MGQTRITIRPLRITDIDDIYELTHMPNVLWGSSLLPSTTLDMWRQRIEHWVQDSRRHIFVSEVQNKAVGVVCVRVCEGRFQHVARLSMAVHDKFQGQGLGKMLMITVLDLADNWLNLVRLELTVFVDNERAIRLYKNFDFEVEGRMRNKTFRGGHYIDSYLMARLSPKMTSAHQALQAQVPASTETADPPQL